MCTCKGEGMSYRMEEMVKIISCDGFVTYRELIQIVDEDRLLKLNGGTNERKASIRRRLERDQRKDECGNHGRIMLR